jgi:hypothetical protein
MTDTLAENTGMLRRGGRIRPLARDEALRLAKRSKRPRDNNDRDEDERRRRQEEALDEALMNTFPASDPIAVEQPARAS